MKKIAVIKGDGIGPEIVLGAIKVLDVISKKYNFPLTYTDVLMGGIAIDKTGVPLPQETIDTCKNSDAVLLGSVGGPKWDKLPGHLRPESGLLGIRRELQVFANLRPAILFPQLKDASALKPEILKDNIDIMVIRELTGGIYFGERSRIDLEGGGQKAWDTMAYSTYEIERIARVGFETARKRTKKLTLVDKANVLESSRLWRELVTKMAAEYPDVTLEVQLVDSCAMQLIKNPGQFDTILTENMFGDILSDEASMLTGSLGMLPSASLGNTTLGIYEPIHGSAPDIAGKDIANPIATIMSVAMMLRYSFNMEDAAINVENAVSKVLDKKYRTVDIMEPGMKSVGTIEMSRLIANEI
ncbi:MAG TPA: 3-isopropylmalate dehydrogenase [Clostridium sp.]|uniref:3-isopropylmalate dehydrogenase n=1 Tax=Clostridium sp. TaxID=1506 RepID=UPI002F91F006